MATDQPRPRDGTEMPPHARWFARSFGRPDFPALSPDDLAAVAVEFHPVVFEPGSILLRAGAPARSVYVIREGMVYLRSGTTGRVLARLGAGAALGDAEVEAAAPYHWTAQAHTRVGALRVAGDRFLALLVARPGVTLRWLAASLRSREAALERIGHVVGDSVEARLCAAMLDLADDRGFVYETHQGLAELIGARRETVSRGIARLRARRVVDTPAAGIVLVDRERAAAVTVGGPVD